MRNREEIFQSCPEFTSKYFESKQLFELEVRKIVRKLCDKRIQINIWRSCSYKLKERERIE